eukprot:g1811.t1
MFAHHLTLPFSQVPQTKRASLRTTTTTTTTTRVKLSSIPSHRGNVPNDVPLPHGVWWLRHTNVREEAVFGDTFVIHRSQDPPLNLVVAPSGDKTVQVWIPNTKGAGIVLTKKPGLLPPEFADEEMTIDVEILTGEEEEDNQSKEETALVFMGSNKITESEVKPSSPRRTSKVKFTCNRCHTRTEKFVNPHAWNHGVVFCRCEGCKVIHLIRDQKGIFSCLKGPLFTQKIDPKTIKIPEGLPQNPSMPREPNTGDDDPPVYWI